MSNGVLSVLIVRYLFKDSLNLLLNVSEGRLFEIKQRYFQVVLLCTC